MTVVSQVYHVFEKQTHKKQKKTKHKKNTQWMFLV